MDVKEAAHKAKNYLTDLYSDEAITNVGLEEVEFDDLSRDWSITVGFSRPWNHRGPLVSALIEGRSDRSYKAVRIHDADGRVVSLKDRLLTANHD